MPNNTLEKWEEKTLGNICDLQNGFAFSSKDYIEYSNTLNIRMSNIRPNGIFDETHNIKYLPDNYAELYKDYILNDGDLIIAMTDMAGDPKILGVPTVIKHKNKNQIFLMNQRVGRLLNFSEDISIAFLKYLLISPSIQKVYKSKGKGGVQLNISKNDILSIKILIPNKIEQQRIVGILDETFENIEKAKQNALQNLNNAKELFENCIENNFTNLTSLYPIKTLSDIAVIKGGKRLPKGQKLTKEITEHPYLRVTDFTIDGTINTDDLHYISDNIYEQIKNYTITSKDLYITIVGATIGKSGIIPKELDGANLTENACKLIFNMDVCNKYVYYFTKTKSFNEQSFGNTKITAVPKLALTRLATIKLPVPNLPKQQKIVAQLDELHEQTKRLERIYEQKIKDLDELKQSILQKAFNGEL